MSRIKNPREKKDLSLDRDRRNVVGENDKASRKNIRRGKQRSRMRIRRSVNQALSKVKGEADEAVAMDAEASARTRTIVLSREAFEKTPDEPLRDVIERQKSARLERMVINALKAAGIRRTGSPSANPIDVVIGEFETYVDAEGADRAIEVIRKALKANPKG